MVSGLAGLAGSTSEGDGGAADSIQISGARLAAFAVVELMENTPDVNALSRSVGGDQPLRERVSISVRDRANSLRTSGEIEHHVDLDEVIQIAKEELLGVGPLATLLEDDDVLEIHVHHHSWVSTVRAKGSRRAEIPFASARSADRILRKLCAVAGAPVEQGEAMVERQVRGGSVKLVAAFPPVCGTGLVATLRKQLPATFTLEDHVRAGTMSRVMATFLGQAIAGHINILVTVASGADGRSVLAGLLSAVRPNEHVVVVHDDDTQLSLPRNGTSILTPLTQDGASAVHLAAALAPDCLFVANCEGLVTQEVLNAVAGGCEGVVAFMHAPTLRHAFARVVPEIAVLRPGASIDAVREWLSSSFDVVVEVIRLRDGRTRISRIAEPAGIESAVVVLRDIYTFTVERTASGGSVEGSFHPTGVVPKIGKSLQARGVVLEPGLFRR